MNIFKELSPKEEASFRQWARDNYRPLNPIQGFWHPTVQGECRKINEETERLSRIIFGEPDSDMNRMEHDDRGDN